MTKNPLNSSRQVIFHQMLVAARKTTLADALSEALRGVDPETAKQQISRFVPVEAQQILAAAGIRDEHVFPVPIVLEAKPTLVGYYRLLLGISQKRFYRAGTGMSKFKPMEQKGLLNSKNKPDLDEFCRVMGQNLAELIHQVSPGITSTRRNSARSLRRLSHGSMWPKSWHGRVETGMTFEAGSRIQWEFRWTKKTLGKRRADGY